MRAAVAVGTAALCMTLVGCGTNAPNNGQVRPSATTPFASAPSASSQRAQFPVMGSSQPNGRCPFLTQTQIQQVLGQRIHPVKGCYYTIPHGTDTVFFAHIRDSVGLLTITYSTPKQARACISEGNVQIRRTYPGSGTRIMKINGLGGQAEVTTLAHVGLLAPLVRGKKELLVGIFWPPAVARPKLAVTLLRQAAVNFSRYTAPETVGC